MNRTPIYNYNRKRNLNPLLFDIFIEWCKLVSNILLLLIILLVIVLLAMYACSDLTSLQTHKHTSTCHKYSHP